MRVTKAPQERRAELMAAARALFDQYGVEKTRVSDIVRKVGVAQGVFYYYFASKEEMVEAVVQQVVAELESRMQTILEDASASFSQKLARYIELYIDVIDQFMADDMIMLPLLTEDDAGNHLLAAQGQSQLQQALMALVRQGTETEAIKIAYPEETAEIVLLGLRGYAARRLPTRRVIYSVAEQALGLPKGELVQYVDEAEKVPAQNK